MTDKPSNIILGSGGRVKPKNIEVYFNEALSILLYGFNWCDLSPDSTDTRVIYIKNPSKVSYTLSLKTEKWTPPEAANYILVYWDREGVILQPQESGIATITITVSPNIVNITDFSHAIIIEATKT